MTKLNLISVGDISLKVENDEQPFKNVKNTLNKKDILFGNLETVLSKKGKKKKKATILNVKPSKVSYLNEAGFDLLNLANNHIFDLGKEGVKNTQETLENNNIEYIGVKEKTKLILEKKGIKVAFLGYPDPESRVQIPYSFSTPGLNEEIIKDDISSIRNECDFIIVSLHWGIENVYYPSTTQIKLAHEIIDAGADVILGHHPHVIQGLEEYHDGLIFYSLGNFQFDTSLNLTSPFSYKKISMIVKLTLDEEKNIEYNIIPCEIDENNIPHVLSKSREKHFFNFFKRISRKIEEITKDEWLDHIAKTYISNSFLSFKKRIKKGQLKALFQLIFLSLSPFYLKCYKNIIKNWWNE